VSSPLESVLATVGADLDAIGASWAVVGGLAVSARAEPRLTRDVDIAVAVHDDAQAELLTRALMNLGYQVLAHLEQTATSRLATVRLLPPSSDPNRVVVDLLFASSGIEPEIATVAERLEIVPGLMLPIAQTGHLIAMKWLARDDRRRPQDADDLEALTAIASDDEVARALSACRLIEERGFHRGRDLVASLRDWLAERRGR
jgi:predicted nucleotidyltransferase